MLNSSVRFCTTYFFFPEPAPKPPSCPSGNGGFQPSGYNLNGPDYVLYSSSQEVVENIFRSELEYEREKRKELERRLESKDNQVRADTGTR